MPCCLSLSKQIWAATLPILALCIYTVPCEIECGEMKGLVQGLKQCWEQVLTYFVLGGGRSLPYSFPPHQKYSQIRQVTDSWTWGSHKQVLPRSPPSSCFLHICSPSGLLSPKVTLRARLVYWMFGISPGFTSEHSRISSPARNMGRGHWVQISAW